MIFLHQRYKCVNFKQESSIQKQVSQHIAHQEIVVESLFCAFCSFTLFVQNKQTNKQTNKQKQKRQQQYLQQKLI